MWGTGWVNTETAYENIQFNTITYNFIIIGYSSILVKMFVKLFNL